ncbi:peptidoglycan bridge formation glycyltransferase FemA/FemB family protein, partial [Streptococcus pyogenes]
MTLKQLSLGDYQDFIEQQSDYSFLQSKEMAILLEKKKMTVRPMGLIKNGQVKVAGLLYSIPMTGGLHMEINSGPVIADEAFVTEFYKEIQRFAKDNGALQ